MRVAVLHDRLAPDAPLDEQDNLVQARAIAGALRDLGHEPALLACGLDLAAAARDLTALAPGIVFNVVEALDGRDDLAASAAALVRSLNLPCTGCGPLGLTLAADKLAVKKSLRSLGLATPSWFTLADLDGPGPDPTGPFLLKPRLEHGSVGIEESDLLPSPDRATLRAALAAKETALAQPCVAEAYLEGREFNVSVLEEADGPRVLPCAEMVFSGFGDRPRILGWRAKWDQASFEHGHTERSFDFPAADAPLLDRLAALARDCFARLDLSGYCRVDFRLDASGAPQIIDLNPNPCMAPDAGFPAAAARAGLAFPGLVNRILDAALKARY